MTSRSSWVGRPLWIAFACLAVLGVPPAAATECHGPVGKNETLWPIALRLRPDPSISPHRVMLSLLEANPEAFIHHNVNTLESGVTLCLGPEDLVGLDDDAAIAEVHRQNQEWKTGRMRTGAESGDPISAPPASAGVDEAALVRLGGILAGFASRLAEVEGRIGDLESSPDPDPEHLERALASLEMRVARIEDRLGVLAAQVETMIRTGEHEAMEPMPTPAPASHEAMEPMPTPAPASHEAMEPMPTPAPASHETLTTEGISARIATWRERVRELREQ